ncbi:1-deoxy-D-xylulose-5-phosphate reductoisomerase [Silvibacterium dinghuense]|uniref:1-deoxy-D-xylulose 5-phosphate reductoisomerase n=1 Tax=Silvibacterium dinghuense TaxID=1560006 RepID=A0A4Q1SFA6_9BACT|nr:1-deoxy-D-xylulose-5-phosphate reductoisomerase [Silvibacterium dinghuense]RXS95568.1 1-deoxy-D-xylulose-5-phosphate reductoisomerase [Silvibacterium dinghuense]GGH14100.1 1-deoxy-D-xylulose 5-phosphate reductoisomerase [Silvibacterium dinghuense]
MKRIAILGSTGSIGQSTLSIIESFPDRYAVASLAAGQNVEEAFRQAVHWRPAVLSMATAEPADQLSKRLREAGVTGVEVVHGSEGTVRVATLPEADFVVSAIVGVAGLEATYAAVLAGKPIGLANKEAMVAAGEILTAAAREKNVPLLPIDSEHNAVHQCMRAGERGEIKRIWLTASGGPFRNKPLAEFESITVEQALKHPTWVMGRRITIDSATLLNKGLEIIEACRLFDMPPSQVKVTVHPESTVHSLVEYVDGSILAQISVTDMRLPILYAMAYPERPVSDLTFDMTALSQLNFQPPDFERFPCLRLAYEAAEAGGAHTIALNAADEIAVAAFLERAIPFTAIPRTIEAVLEETPETHPTTIAEVLALDAEAREAARRIVATAGRTSAPIGA